MSRRIFAYRNHIAVAYDHDEAEQLLDQALGRTVDSAEVWDITNALSKVSVRIFGPENRQSAYAFYDVRQGNLLVTGTATAIAAVADQFETLARVTRQRNEATQQFNHLSGQLSEVAAKLTQTEAALGRAHDVIANKQRHIEMLEKQAAHSLQRSLHEQCLEVGGGRVVYGSAEAISEVDRLKRREHSLTVSAQLAVEKLGLAKYALTGEA